ncbi:MAG: transglycosylase domain-containing protein [Oscillospiraceae bacterium]|nr:transglycosylase domain-containing protein [Oscillospiraceae bacterium]
MNRPSKNTNTPAAKKTFWSGILFTFKSVGWLLYTALTVVLSTLMVIVITCCIVASVLSVYILNMVDDTTEIDLRNIDLSYTTIMYAEDKETDEYVEIHRMQANENREWVDLDDIPEIMINATIAAEDKRFETHQGVDWQRTVYSFLNYFLGLSEKQQGGSTITQQLIKNITDDRAVRLDRKVREIFRALSLEKNYSKDEIMEAYLNVIPFGNNTNGVQAAADFYFDKDVSELNLAECCSLLAMTNSPSKYNLKTSKGAHENFDRRKYILNEMLELEMIDYEEYRSALITKVEAVTTTSTNAGGSVYNSWFVDHAIEEVKADLMEEYGYTGAEAMNLLNNGGLRIYTTVDTDIQNILEEIYANPDNFPDVKYDVRPQSGMIIMDYTGSIQGVVGGIGEKEGNRLFNRATMAKRQVGSTIKPISPYAMAFESDLITYSTIMSDEPVFTAEEDGWENDYPSNFDEKYIGDITVAEALHRSKNTIAVYLANVISPQRCFNFLTNKLHITTLHGQGEFNDVDLGPMALGALTDGMTMLELAGAYQIYGNGGLYYEPHAYTVVKDSDGNVILENDIIPERAVSPETATIINKLMQGVVSAPEGSGRAANFETMQIAGKTGTTSNNVDLLFVGLTPYYVGAVYLGYDEPERIEYVQYSSTLTWKMVMQRVHEGLEYAEFDVWGNVEEHTYCKLSGDLATETCEETATGWYKKSNVPGYCVECLESAERGEYGDQQVIVIGGDESKPDDDPFDD